MKDYTYRMSILHGWLKAEPHSLGISQTRS